MANKRMPQRQFSEELKLKVVKDIETGKATIAQVCREFSVSNVSVYKWLNKYSQFHKRGAKIIVELKSEAYRSKELEKKVQDLEAALGRKQLEVEFLNKLIELASDDLGVDIKKKHYTQPSTGLGSKPKKKGGSK
jgi:transposase